MITANLTPHNQGNRATSRETINGAIAINFEAIKKTIMSTIEQLTPEQAEVARAGHEEIITALATAQEQEAIRKKLAEHGFKNTDLTATETQS